MPSAAVPPEWCGPRTVPTRRDIQISGTCGVNGSHRSGESIERGSWVELPCFGRGKGRKQFESWTTRNWTPGRPTQRRSQIAAQQSRDTPSKILASSRSVHEASGSFKALPQGARTRHVSLTLDPVDENHVQRIRSLAHASVGEPARIRRLLKGTVQEDVTNMQPNPIQPDPRKLPQRAPQGRRTDSLRTDEPPSQDDPKKRQRDTDTQPKQKR